MAPDLYLAMIFVLLTYGGWNDMSYVAAEVRRPRKNLLRALLLGTFSIAVLYLLVNLAFIRVLGFAGVQNSQAVAADAVAARLGDWGGRAISALICVSCLGAINAMIFTVSRVYYAVGKQHRLFALVARWNRRRDAPTRALLLQMAVTLAVVVGFGLQKHGFRRIVDFTTPVFWFFFLLVGLSLFVLRVKDRHIERPYRVHGYPLTPALFCLSCLFMLYASLSYAYAQASWEAGWSIGLLLLGVLLSFLKSAECGARSAE
jgi:amino acid transporter